MTLVNPDSNGIKRYAETTPVSTFSALLNLALQEVSDWVTNHRPTVYRRASATISNGSTLQTISFPTKIVGEDFSHTSGVFTCDRAGVYEVLMSVAFAANGTGARRARLLGSGSLGERSAFVLNPSALQQIHIPIRWIITLAVGDTITTQAAQESGGSLGVEADITFRKVA